MSRKVYFLTAGSIFTIIAVLHLARLVFGWEAVIAGAVVPAWPSLVGLVIAGYLGYEGFRLSRRL